MLIILFAGIIIFLSDKSRPNRDRPEGGREGGGGGSGANWGMRCDGGALHPGRCDHEDPVQAAAAVAAG